MGLFGRSDFNRAITVYIGRGSEVHPKPDFQRVVDKLGSKRARAVEAAVLSAVAELYAHETDWSRVSMTQAAGDAVARVQTLFPKLDAESREALSWDFLWNFK